jgi:hypothetical protein
MGECLDELEQLEQLAGLGKLGQLGELGEHRLISLADPDAYREGSEQSETVG